MADTSRFSFGGVFKHLEGLPEAIKKGFVGEPIRKPTKVVEGQRPEYLTDIDITEDLVSSWEDVPQQAKPPTPQPVQQSRPSVSRQAGRADAKRTEDIITALSKIMTGPSPTTAVQRAGPTPSMFASSDFKTQADAAAGRRFQPFMPTGDESKGMQVLKGLAHAFTSTQQSRDAYHQALAQNHMQNINLNFLQEQQKQAKQTHEVQQQQLMMKQQELAQKMKATQGLFQLAASAPEFFKTEQGAMIGKLLSEMGGHSGNIVRYPEQPGQPAVGSENEMRARLYNVYYKRFKGIFPDDLAQIKATEIVKHFEKMDESHDVQMQAENQIVEDLMFEMKMGKGLMDAIDPERFVTNGAKAWIRFLELEADYKAGGYEVDYIKRRLRSKLLPESFDKAVAYRADVKKQAGTK